MTLNDIMAIILRYFAEFGSFRTLWRYIQMLLLLLLFFFLNTPGSKDPGG